MQGEFGDGDDLIQELLFEIELEEDRDAVPTLDPRLMTTMQFIAYVNHELGKSNEAH